MVLDTSALIPLSWIGRLDLLEACYDELDTTDAVRDEVLVDGKPGVASLRSFLDGVEIVPTPERAATVAELDGIAAGDASVILLADRRDAALVANDRGLVEVARTHGVECDWVTTMVLRLAADGTLDGETASDVLYDLVDAGMNLDPTVYARLQRRLDELGG